MKLLAFSKVHGPPKYRWLGLKSIGLICKLKALFFLENVMAIKDFEKRLNSAQGAVKDCAVAIAIHLKDRKMPINYPGELRRELDSLFLQAGRAQGTRPSGGGLVLNGKTYSAQVISQATDLINPSSKNWFDRFECIGQPRVNKDIEKISYLNGKANQWGTHVGILSAVTARFPTASTIPSQSTHTIGSMQNIPTNTGIQSLASIPTFGILPLPSSQSLQSNPNTAPFSHIVRGPHAVHNPSFHARNFMRGPNIGH